MLLNQVMIARILPALFVFGFAGLVFAEDTTSVTATNPPKTDFTPERPAYLYFKEGTLTRDGKMKINVDITLDGEIPNALNDRKVVYSFTFDVDNNGATGTKFITFPGFGSDITFDLVKEEKETKFFPNSGTLVYKGKKVDIKVSKLKVSGDKITCQLSSELFGAYDSLRMYAMSNQEFFERGLSKGNDNVDQFPRKGALTLGREK